MGNNQFVPQFNDKGQDNAATSKGSLPEFDLHDLYKQLDKFPVNPIDRNDNSISFDPIYKGNERWDPYKLPATEVVQTSGQDDLEALGRRITDKAVANVQKHMTPQETKDLNEDTVKYGKQMEQYKEHMRHVMMGTGGIGLDDPPPGKPASMIKYENAINAEIKRIAQSTC